MIHVTLIIEDTTIVATGRERSPDADGPDMVNVLVSDNHSGKSERAVWTVNDLSVVLALAMGMGEENLIEPETTERLYQYIRDHKLFDGWAPEVVPTP